MMAKTGSTMTAGGGGTRPVQPEDNWELTANPSNYLDQLP
jgi:hypothetical protein